MIIIYLYIIVQLVACAHDSYDDIYRIGKYEITRKNICAGEITGNELTDELSKLLKDKYDCDFVVCYKAYYEGYNLVVDFYATPVDKQDFYFTFDVIENGDGELQIFNSDYDDVMNKVNYARTIKQKVVFIYQHLNFADEKINEGYYIDNKGYKVKFDFSNTPKAVECDSIDKLYCQLLNDHSLQGEKYMYLDELGDCYKSLLKLDESAQMEKSGDFANDAGSECWYGVKGDNKDLSQFILLKESGDVEMYNTDSNALQIMNMLEICK